MDINSLLSSITGNAQQRVAQTQSMEQKMAVDTAKMQELMTLNEQEAAAVTQTASQLAAEEAALSYRVNKAKEANAAIAGLNPDDQENEYIRSMAVFNTEQEAARVLERQRAESMRTVESMASADLLSNPLQYLVAQLALPQAAARHNSILNQEVEALNRRDVAAANINTRVNLLKQKDSILPANTAEALNELTLKKADLASQTAQIQLRAAQAENISKLGARALDQYRLAGETYQIQSDMFNKLMSIEQWKTQQAALAEQRAERAAARAAAASAKAEGDAERELFNRQLAAASAALGYTTPLTVTSLKALPRDTAEQIIKVAMSGKFGTSALESIATIKQAGNAQAIQASNPGMSQFMRGVEMGIQNYQQAVTTEALAKGSKLKPGEAIKEAADRYEFEVTESAMSFAAPRSLNSPTYDTTLNPYKPNYFAMLDAVDAGRLPQLKDSSVIQAIRTLKAAEGGNLPNLTGKHMEMLVKTVSQQVADGKLPLEKATLDLARFHQFAAAQNLQLYNYTQFGLPQQTSAIISVPAVTSFSKPFKLDLMDPLSVKKELTRMAVEQKKGTIGMVWQEGIRPALLAPLGGATQLDAMIAKEKAAQTKK